MSYPKPHRKQVVFTWRQWLARRPSWRSTARPLGPCVACRRPAYTTYDGVVLHPCCPMPSERTDQCPS